MEITADVRERCGKLDANEICERFEIHTAQNAVIASAYLICRGRERERERGGRGREERGGERERGRERDHPDCMKRIRGKGFHIHDSLVCCVSDSAQVEIGKPLWGSHLWCKSILKEPANSSTRCTVLHDLHLTMQHNDICND